jgi:lysophospholipid acyltransferase (LPLAT)-like uncharacterized protein
MDRSGFRDTAKAGLITLAQGLFKVWFSTCRLKILNEYFHNEAVAGNRQYIGVTWHRAAIFYCFFYGPLHPMILFSQSQDGEYLTQFARKCGVIPVRGSSSRGGLKALIHMIRYLKAGNRMCATVLDGPQGPRHEAKKGFLLLAKETGIPLVPLMWSARRVITLEKTWDKTMIPLPFSKVFISYGPPLTIPKECSEQTLEDFRLEIQNRLNTLMDEMDKTSGYKTRWGDEGRGARDEG